MDVEDHRSARIRELEESLVQAEARIAHLNVALAETRRIAVAIGIVMERRRVTEEIAHQHLIRLSNASQRKVREIAADIVLTGMVDETP